MNLRQRVLHAMEMQRPSQHIIHAEKARMMECIESQSIQTNALFLAATVNSQREGNQTELMEWSASLNEVFERSLIEDCVMDVEMIIEEAEYE